jgi:transcription antitermination factor NusG
MSSGTLWQEPAVSPPVMGESAQWYAIHTRARHEKMATTRLQEQGITTFLPTTTEVRRWSDRRKLVEFPLFSCYAFVNLPWRPELRAKIVRTDGVLGFVGFCGGAVPIPDIEIENIRTVLAGMVPCSAYPFLKIGQRVRVRGGSLDGVEGILVARNGNNTLVISVEPIQRSLAIRIDGYTVEAA